MSFWLRITLTWLLALALPLQGHAAQTLRLCAPGYAERTLPQAEAHRAAAGPHASIEEADGHGHHADVGRSGADLTAEPHHGSAGKCSVGAVCCAMFAMTSTPLVFESLTSPTHYATELLAHRRGNIPWGFERPPRRRLS